MSDPVIINEPAAHRKFAADCFNKIWPLLEKKDRTSDDNELLVHLAHASLYHWLQAGAPVNEQRGEWMLARVYTVLGDTAYSMHHAKRCLALTEKHGFRDFDLAYAYEAMARASALSHLPVECKKYLELARKAAEEIAEKEDRELFLNDLSSEPWFGMK
ncbi:MAG TPA: hypothetical protein VNJ07_14255 [Chitinophagales bacterium]|nr:hypothetical protein [Chitinophagales bacterium]